MEARNRFIRDTFGRFLTDEVVSTLLDSPSGVQTGGEKRKITMLMADLRGFTSLSERMDPKWVVSILNRYLSTMVTIVKKYGGTVDEFIGDAVFVLFGAPTWQDDDAQRAVACAVEMQLAMAAVNEHNRTDGLPEVEMGIGLHTGQVIVGNIGSSERLKYGVVGSHVNLTSRIQSFTVGGQILASESTRREVGRMLKIGKQMEVRAKGFEQQIALCEVLGIGGPHKLMLYQSADTLVDMTDPIALTCLILEGELQSEETFRGRFLKLSPKQGEARLEKGVPVLSNLKLRLMGEDGQELAGALFGKVVSTGSGGKSEVLIHFTSMSREIETFLGGRRKKAVGGEQSLPASIPSTELPPEPAALQ